MDYQIKKYTKLENKPFVSVIVTTFNRSSLLLDTVNSILSQTFKDFELLIIDDGSTDDTESKIMQLDDERVSYILVEHWGGPAKPRNIGICQSAGKYIAFCDDDDIWEPDKLLLQVNTLKQGWDLCFSNIRYIDENHEFSRRGIANAASVVLGNYFRNLFEYYLYFSNPVTLSSVIVDRRIVENQLFLEEKKLIAVEDYELWLRIARECRQCYLKEELVKYRVHANNISQNKKKGLEKSLNLFRYKYNAKDKGRTKLFCALAIAFLNLRIKLSSRS
jgi:glycosyltransferase involved in cell wall biosynthesis